MISELDTFTSPLLPFCKGGVDLWRSKSLRDIFDFNIYMKCSENLPSTMLRTGQGFIPNALSLRGWKTPPILSVIPADCKRESRACPRMLLAGR